MATGKTVRSTLLLPEHVHYQVQAVAAANDISSTWMIQQAVLHHLSTRTGKSELTLGTDRR